MTIDGSYSNAGNYLLFNNYASGAHIMILQLQSAGAGSGCIDFVIRNCKCLTGSSGSATANTIDIQVGGMNPLDGGADNSNILIENNIFNTAYYGLFLRGISGYKADGIIISNNSFGANQSSIGYNSILVSEATNVQVTNNTITGYMTNTNLTAGQKGIYLISSTNTVISKNRIYGMKTLLNGSKGMVISYSSNVNIYNNLVYDIGGPGYYNITSADNPNNMGISVEGTSASVNIYYNTINLFGTFNRYMATVSAAVYLSSQCSGVNLKDNILTNKILNAHSSSAKGYSIYNAGNSGVFSSINYNDYFGNGPQYILGYLAGDKNTIADWQSATGSDLQSLAADPQFQTDIQVQPIAGSPVLAAGVPIAGITVDIENVLRSTTNPSMGAYEIAFVLPAVD